MNMKIADFISRRFIPFALFWLTYLIISVIWGVTAIIIYEFYFKTRLELPNWCNLTYNVIIILLITFSSFITLKQFLKAKTRSGFIHKIAIYLFIFTLVIFMISSIFLLYFEKVVKRTEAGIKIRYNELYELENSKNFKAIYDSFFSPISKTEQITNNYVTNYYLDDIKKYHDEEKIIKSEVKIKKITIDNNEALVDRTIVNCYDTDCLIKTTDDSIVRWLFIKNNWYTTQEFPLCVRTPPYNTPASLFGKTKFIDEYSKVNIIFSLECDMFPISWLLDPINAQVTELSKPEYDRTLTIIKSILKKYPNSLLKKNLKRIYMLNSIKMFNTNYGGTANQDGYIYVTNQGEQLNYTAANIERMLHHEFLSVLLAYNEPTYNKQTGELANPNWNAINPKEFEYGTGGVEEIQKGTSSEEFDSNLIKIGFLNQYSQSSMENDFSEIASNLFKSNDNFWRIVDTNALIRKKVDLAIKFYNKLDPIFTEAYFRKIQNLE